MPATAEDESRTLRAARGSAGGRQRQFSDANLDALAEIGFRYVLALRDRSDQAGDDAIKLAFKSGLPGPRAPPVGQVRAQFKLVEVELIAGARHVVVYSPFKALHDFEVRQRRLERSREALARLREQAAKRKLSHKEITERATRILVENKSARYFSYLPEKGFFSFWLKRDEYRRQRRHDGLFVLRSNHPTMSAQEILDAYLQLQEIERCFRVIKSVLELRPVYHHRQRRVETHVFLNFLAFLLVKTLEQKLRAAGLEVSIAWALEQLARLKAVEHTWEEEAIGRRRRSWFRSPSSTPSSRPSSAPSASASPTQFCASHRPPRPDPVRIRKVGTSRVQIFKDHMKRPAS